MKTKIQLQVVEGSQPSVCSQTGGGGLEASGKHHSEDMAKRRLSPVFNDGMQRFPFYGEITDVIYRFSPMTLSKEEWNDAWQ